MRTTDKNKRRESARVRALQRRAVQAMSASRRCLAFGGPHCGRASRANEELARRLLIAAAAARLEGAKR